MDAGLDPTLIDVRLESRSISYENPTGERNNAGRERGGRKGHPSPILAPGQKEVLADITGSGTIRHIWMTLAGSSRPELDRALRFEVFYDGMDEPSISTPLLDFFGLPHGREAEYYSEMISVNEGRGLNSYIPMPFAHSIRFEVTNESHIHVGLPYQIDYTLSPSIPENPSYLHATFRRENPTTLRQDFVIAEWHKGPGRFLGCAVGIRVLDTERWYGEGEVKIYLDGDREFPSICGSGLEDYVGTARGMNRYSGPYSGAPIMVSSSPPDSYSLVPTPNFVSFYRWHVRDPIIFSDYLRVTAQQLGAVSFMLGEEAEFEEFRKDHPPGSSGWLDYGGDVLASGLFERVDDYCATAYVYCRDPQPVARYDTEVATRDIGLLPSEQRPPFSEADADRSSKYLKDAMGL